MGLFSSSKKSSTQNITTTTNTETNIRDIGLSGAHAVQLATNLQAGANESEAIRAQSLDKITQQVGTSYNQLVGGANNLVNSGVGAVSKLSDDVREISDNQTEATTGFLDTIRSLGSNAEKQTASAANLIQNAASEAQNTVRTLSSRAVGEDTDFVKVMPFVAVVLVGAAAFAMRGK